MKTAQLHLQQPIYMLSFLLAMLLLIPNAFATNNIDARLTDVQTDEGNSELISPQLVPQSVPLLTIKGAIGPATADYLIGEIDRANAQLTSELIMITLDTPGGLVSSLREINQAILSSNIPIACLVTPQGARAASAGTYMLYACHIAAMSPATTLGAATPVSIGPNTQQEKEKDASPSAMEKKVLKDAIAYIRSLAQLRGRNQEWAELAVKEAATLTAEEAVEMQVVDLLSPSPQALLTTLQGWQVAVADKTVTLSLTSSQLMPVKADWRNQFIATVTNPNIAYILMLIGIYGLLLEFYNPGIGIAGVTGGICLILALYAFAMLPLNYAGMALLALGIVLMAMEALSPSVGVLGIGGVIAFALGSIFLFDSEFSQFRVAIPLVAAVSVMSGLFSLFVLGAIYKGRNAKPVSGTQTLIGAVATAEHSFDAKGLVHIRGESWCAHTSSPVEKGQPVKITQIDGLILTIAPLSGASQTSKGEE